MSELWQVALDHHLYILLPAALGVWLWGRGRPANRRQKQSGAWAWRLGGAWVAVRSRLSSQQSGPPTTAQLHRDATRLRVRREDLAKQAAALEAELDRDRRPRGGIASTVLVGRGRSRRQARSDG